MPVLFLYQLFSFIFLWKYFSCQEFIWVLQSKSMEHEDARDFNRPETQSRSCQELLVDLQTIFLSFSSYLLISMTQEISYQMLKVKENWNLYFLNLRTSEIHLFYNLQLFYWHFLEFLWLFIFLVFYKLFAVTGTRLSDIWTERHRR